MKTTGKIEAKRAYPPILPGPKEWPVVLLSKNRKQFIDTVVSATLSQLKSVTGDRQTLVEELELTRYLEQNRIKENPWKIDPEDDEVFWKDIKSRLVAQANDAEEDQLQVETILRDIVTRYAEEIAGNFKQSRYRLARTIISFGFARLLNAARIKGLKALFSKELDLPDKIHLLGEVEQLRNLAKLGTVVLVPTHFSNLDSVLIGWVIQHLGLPPFIYGAGLNLFNIGIFAYFMDSLGAYKVDRRKKNPLYLQTLKTYSTEALKYGCHSLFFPGGTRSRSGKIEDKLKMGLLGTALEAQRLNFEAHPDKADKIFVVPMVLNYHFVLEAPSLIREHLSRRGQERFYQERDEFSTSYKIIKFLIKFFTRGSGISVSIGRGMDLMGNYVNESGESMDQHQRVINLRHYFSSQGKITNDPQRDAQYTQILADRIIEEYHKINRVFSSHLVAFTGFQILRKRYKKLDLFNFLRLAAEEQSIEYQVFKNAFESSRNKIFALYESGSVQIAPHLTGELDAVIDHGLFNVGLYHAKRPLMKNKEGNIITEDLNTLYFYRNRMIGYGLENDY